LLDKIINAKEGRIINVSSLAHVRSRFDKEPGHIYFEDLQSEKVYKPGRAYSQSKLANVLFTREL
jgi:NAD(P)-dependent dehydrogenase (short-subunit alcohol dehydrogenase family)